MVIVSAISIFSDMMQKAFTSRVADTVKKDSHVTGVAVSGSWISGEMNEYSDQ